MNILKTAVALVAIGSSIPAISASPDLAPGIRVIGQATDGTLVLDDSVSGLSDWATPGLATFGDAGLAEAPLLLTIGHFESFDSQSGTIVVSGQRLVLDKGAVVIDAPRDVENSLGAGNLDWYLAPGRYVAVAGSAFGGGENLATHVVRLDNEVQPGSVPIYVRGSVDYYDLAQGIAYIGSMSLDVTTTTSSPSFATGEMVELIGYQADSATAIVTDYSSLEKSTQKTKLAGINGSGVKGITGSGVKTKGINGSGVKGITGSGVKTKGINGSGVKGITGSGVKTKGINGSGVKGITGSGVKTKGINGSGLTR
jgi:hypothetical protein